MVDQKLCDEIQLTWACMEFIDVMCSQRVCENLCVYLCVRIYLTILCVSDSVTMTVDSAHIVACVVPLVIQFLQNART